MAPGLSRLAALVITGVLLASLPGQGGAAPAGASRAVDAGANPAAKPAAPDATTPVVSANTDLPASSKDESRVPHYFGPYSNWANSPQVMVDAVVSITGGGGTGATAVAEVNPKTGAITSVTVTSPGSGYTSIPDVAITAAGVAPDPASAVAVISEGVVSSIAVDEAGAGFKAPQVSFSGGTPTPGHTATAVASGGVDDVTLVSGGSGYVLQPLVEFSLPDQPDGTQATGRATMNGSGVVTGVQVVTPGSGYTSAPTVIVRDGANAAADPVVVEATISISAIAVTSGGLGYDSAPTVTISDTVGTADKGASATATVAVEGAVTAVNVVDHGGGYLTPGIRKFVDTLPGIGEDNANDLGNYIPVAEADTTTYPGTDYYEIALVQYRQQLHQDLPATLLRGYVQLATVKVPGKHIALTNANLDPNIAPAPALLPDGSQAYGVDNPLYLGPTIIASKDRPVRILFRNLLPTGVGGDLFLPVDTTLMGSGMTPDMVQLDQNHIPQDTAQDFGSVMDEVRNPQCGFTPKPMGCYTENRATLHLHGGITPWISDGTPHQWITPAGESTSYPTGVSVSNVPDMPDPGPGAQTFFYTNQQSARLMFYHDHAWGITRLNVYAGEAAGYLVTDATEQALIAPGGALDGLGVGTPLIIQDKTFVPADIASTDPTWQADRWGGEGNLWAPHVYMPAQNPGSKSGSSAFGRWMYGPWFWPPATDAKYQPIPNPYYEPACDPDTADFCEPAEIPGTPNVSVGMEAFNDTPLVNGTPYPTTTVDPKAYRFRILNASDDRTFNLSWYVADPTTGTLSEVALKADELAAAQTDPNVFPTPDTSKSPAGPSWIQIGSEGGFLPTPTVVPAHPITWITDPTRFDVGNVDQHSLLLAAAERADVIVDFSQYRGKTLILYNDAPAAYPARVASYDYYTGDPDLAPVGAHTTLPGYGPNTRTVMQVKVADIPAATAWDRPNTTNDRMGKLMAAFAHHLDGDGKPAGVFESGSDPIIVGQAAYNTAYGTHFISSGWCSSSAAPSTQCDGYARISEGSQPTDKFKFDTLAGDQLSIPFQPKAIHDEMNAANFDDYGRNTANLGLEAPGATPLTQNIILYPYVNPATEVLDSAALPSSLAVTPIASADDGTQIWKITHNGVDTHPIHFHLFDVQVINRVTWDNIIIPPDPSELGWKETVRVSPLEDTYVAVRPIVPTLPFGIPDSRRPLNPAMPIGATGSPAGPAGGPGGHQAGFNNTNASGAGITPIVNEVVDFGWEYVWHCHILSHEEMDMMRPMSVLVPSAEPDPVVVTASQSGPVVLTWTDPTPVDYTDPATWGSPKAEIGFHIRRATLANGVPGAFDAVGEALANQTTWTDTTAVAGVEYRYEVIAWNESGLSTPGSADGHVGLVVTASSPTINEGDPVPDIHPSYAPDEPGTATEPVCTTDYTQGAPAGEYTSTCSGIAVPDPEWGSNITYVDGVVTVIANTITPVEVTAPSFSVAYGDAVPALTPAYNPDMTPKTAPVCTTTYTPSSPVSGSPYPVTCSGAKDPYYSFTYVAGAITVTPAPVVAHGPNLTVDFGAAVPALVATYTPSITPATPASCLTAYTQGASVAGGPYAVTCSGAADPNYSFTYAPGSITVAATEVVVHGPARTVHYGDAIPSLAPTYTPNITPDTPATCETTYTAASPVSGSPYAITCSGAADGNHTFSYAAGTVTVQPAPLQITASSSAFNYGGTVPAVTPHYAGLAAVDLAPATPPTCSTTATSSSAPGDYPSTCSGAADPNYDISYVAGTIRVRKAPQGISFAQPANRTWGTVAFTVSATATSGLPVTFSSDTESTCTVSGYAVLLVAPGDCTIRASQAGNANYNAATDVTRTVTIAKAAATVTSTPEYVTIRQGSTLPVDVVVNAVNSLAGAPSGSVQLIVDGVDAGAPVALDLASSATLSTSGLTLGIHSISVRYLGDALFLGATGLGSQVTVASVLTTTIAVVPSVNPSVRGQTVTYTATVTPQNLSLGSGPTGVVQFYRDGKPVGLPRAVDGAGHASLAISNSAVGSHPVRAVYKGDAAYAGSSSPNVTQVVKRAATTVVLTLKTPASRAATLVYKAVVKAKSPGSGTPSGKVRFYRGTTLIGTATLSGGVATLRYRNSRLTLATYSIKAVYLGSSQYASSTSTIVRQRIIR